MLVPVDNSVAHWTLLLALRGSCPSLEEVGRLVAEDRIPVAMVLSQAERQRAKFVCTKVEASLNQLGWKVCHIDAAAVGGRGAITNYPIDVLREHFIRYASPRNMVLVPLLWAGLGEMPEFIRAAAKLGPA